MDCIGEPELGPSGAGSRVTYEVDWGFLASYQGGKANSVGTGDGNVTVADVGDGAGCAGVEDGGGVRAGGGGERSFGGPVTHGPLCLHARRCRLVLVVAGSAYLPTLNLCQPTITGYPFFPRTRASLLERVPMPNSEGLRDARWICITRSLEEGIRATEMIRRSYDRSAIQA
ncbi:hypothetical protein KM043_007053 [Ampulex compressa]|nr:hypothetical protein KM043_007053 [Ampulex compressa]